MNAKLLIASTGMALVGVALAAAGYYIRSGKRDEIAGFNRRTSPDPQVLAALIGVTLYRFSAGCLLVAVLTLSGLPYRTLVRPAFVAWSAIVVLLFAISAYRAARERVSMLVADLMKRNADAVDLPARRSPPAPPPLRLVFRRPPSDPACSADEPVEEPREGRSRAKR